MKKTKYVGMRVSADEWVRLCAVQENIASVSRGQKPEISEIIRSLVFAENPDLLSDEERLFLSFKTDILHGEAAIISKLKPVIPKRDRTKNI